MECFFPLMKALGSFLAFLLVHKLVCKMIRDHSSKSIDQGAKQPPEPPGAWPVIGHLRLLGGQVPPCRTLGNLADRHGPIFTIRLGDRKAVVVSSWEAVKECFTTLDQVFLTRPKSAASTYMGYRNALFGLSPYGSYWREIRKICTLELLSKRRLDLLADVRASELQSCIKHLYNLCLAAAEQQHGLARADMSWWFLCVTMNTKVRMLSGKRYSGVEDGVGNVKSRTFMKAIEEFMYLSGVFVTSDFIPYVKWLDLQGYVRSMKRNAAKLDKIMSEWLEEHLHKYKRNESVKKVQEQDFIDALLSQLGDNIDALIHGHKSEDVIKATTLNLIVAGVDTSFVSLNWALSLLLNHNQVLKKAQEELDHFVGRERWVEESDTKNLVYLQAIIKETLRLYPPGPLSTPREAMEDCCLAGYHVPKGTILLVNLWKLHRDPRIWQEPKEFKPERFLTTHADVDVRGHQFEYIPFSSGRRVCPGIALAMRVMSLTLARVLQGFNLINNAPRNESIDMGEGLGLTMSKITPVEVLLSPRLPDELYKNA